jgi:hypothetical protein
MKFRVLCPILLILALPAVRLSAQTTQPAAPPLQTAIARIASGDATEAQDAARRLALGLNSPLREALAGLHQRPPVEQFRVLSAVDAAIADLRASALRATLPDEDRALFDRFQEVYPDLVRRMFHPNPAERRQALDQIPREPGLGAGVLVAALAFDDDIDNARAALQLARELRDPALPRNLRRYVQFLLELLASDELATGRETYEIVLGEHLLLAAEALAASGDAGALSAIQTVLDRYVNPTVGEYFDRGPVYRALGTTFGEAAGPLLARYLDDGRIERNAPHGAGAVLIQKGGDVALLELLQVYGLTPTAAGMVESERMPGEPGFLSDVDRKKAHGLIRRWLAENAEKPGPERKPLQP